MLLCDYCHKPLSDVEPTGTIWFQIHIITSPTDMESDIVRVTIEDIHLECAKVALSFVRNKSTTLLTNIAACLRRLFWIPRRDRVQVVSEEE